MAVHFTLERSALDSIDTEMNQPFIVISDNHIYSHTFNDFVRQIKSKYHIQGCALCNQLPAPTHPCSRPSIPAVALLVVFNQIFFSINMTQMKFKV